MAKLAHLAATAALWVNFRADLMLLCFLGGRPSDQSLQQYKNQNKKCSVQGKRQEMRDERQGAGEEGQEISDERRGQEMKDEHQGTWQEEREMRDERQGTRAE